MNDTSSFILSHLVHEALDYMNLAGYSEKTTYSYRLVWKHLLSYVEEEKEHYYTPDIGKAFLQDHYGILPDSSLKPSQISKLRAVAVLQDFMEKGLFEKCHRPHGQPLLKSFDSAVSDFALSCQQKGLHQNTVRGKTNVLKVFMAYLTGAQLSEISNMDLKHITGFLNTLSGYSDTTRASFLFTLREFLAFMYQSDCIPKPLHELFPVIHTNRREHLPSHYQPEELKRLLTSVDRRSSAGSRDYAMLLLAVQIGMRVSDIKGLKLEDIKWGRNLIEFVQEKTGDTHSLPLGEELKFSLLYYLKNHRPDSDSSYVFLRSRPPYDPLSYGNKLYGQINKYFTLAGIDTAGRKHGMHSMRSSLAGNLLSDGIPLPVITEVLGHKNPNSTLSYTRTATEQLRCLSLEVPDGK